MTLTVEDIFLEDPARDLAYDEEILARAERGEGGETLRFWELSAYAVVLGRTCSLEANVLERETSRDRIPVLRRSSGGGTVLQGPGCLNFSLVLKKDRDPALGKIHDSYRFILDKVLSAVRGLGVRAEFRPVCDLVLVPGEKKFSGNAQRRGKTFLLHHGTLLYAFDLERVSRYLKMPPQMPDYRKSRSHQDFISNIPVSPQEMRQALARAFA